MTGGFLKDPMAESRLLGISDVLAEEFRSIHRTDPPTAPPGTPDEAALRKAFFDAETTALCLSGGGIRSASFCLGIAQGLARAGLLARFDYLSTVSGGGYLGSMLAAWAYRAPGGMTEVQSELAAGSDGRGLPIAWWRENLSYLAPRRGLLSLDTWTLFSTYLRNLLLNALVWLPMIAIALLCPHLVAATIDWVASHLASTTEHDRWATMTMLVGAGEVAAATVLLRVLVGHGEPKAPKAPNAPNAPADARTAAPIAPVQPAGVASSWRAKSSTAIQILLLTGVAAMTCGAWWIVRDPTRFFDSGLRNLVTHFADSLGLDDVSGKYVSLALLYAVASGMAAVLYQMSDKKAFGVRILTFLAGVVCGCLTGIAIAAIIAAFLAVGQPPLTSTLTFMPPALIAAVGFGEILFVGLTSKWSSDFDREWWARAGAWASLYTAGWLALFLLAFGGPMLLHRMPEIDDQRWPYWIVVTLISGAIARLVLVVGRTTPKAVDTPKQPRKSDLFVDASAALALLALLIGIADVLQSLLQSMARLAKPLHFVSERVELPYALGDVIILSGIFAVVLIVAASGVNINRFSLHAMYRDRLIRAFLGATRGARQARFPVDEPYREGKQFEERKADPFIQFDRDDNPIFRWLARDRGQGQPDLRKRPFLLVNAALNLVRGRNLAWQERKAASFTFSALHTGSASPGFGYRSSSDYAADVGGITLGTAMAVSGAALSPNAGAFSTPIRTFLLTLFNARLGWWLGHPVDARAVRRSGPSFAIVPMLRELFGLTDDRPPWMFVSDGGHFDNLGLYEVVRRGCRHVVVVDSGCDPFRNFDDLGNAIRKVRIDLGITIQRSGPWRFVGRDADNGGYSALFEIQYDDGAKPSKGWLLYIKPSLYYKAARLPIDVLQYASRSPLFPHESTADQFFSESQFESYRALGEFEIAEIAGTTGTIDSVAQFIDLASFPVRE